jgi:4-cresol dehydrogenase (hydroxylating) flavoprotein subunit
LDTGGGLQVAGDVENNHQQFLAEVERVLGADHVVSSPAEIERRSRDPVPGSVPPLAFLYPGSVEDIVAVVRLADRYAVSVWPHSTGRNWGWSNSPTAAGAVSLILERMNRILHVDEELAYAVVEPGVTYADLNNYLKARKIKLWSDCTGGPPQGSVLGNALDRGVGVTTHGEHFASLCGLEVVLPNGTVIRTGAYPSGKDGTRHTYKYGIGPYLDGLFSQTNFGVVTQAGVWLMPEPESHLMFGFNMEDEQHLVPLLNALRRLALHGVVPDKIRLTNDFAVLTLLTQRFKANVEGRGALTPADMRRLNDKYHFGVWSFVSSVYGHKEQVEAVRRIVVRELSPYGRLLFFDDRKVGRIEKWLPALMKLHRWNSRLVDGITGRFLKLSLPMVQMLPPLYQIYKGIPTEGIVRRAYFRSPKEAPVANVHVAEDNVGLMWFGPLMPLDGQTVFELVDRYRTRFHECGFDCYITILMLNARTVVPLMGIIYRKEDAAETERAVALYHELHEDSLTRGYQQFRCGRLGWPSIYKHNPQLLELNTKLKEVFDPRHTIAPGKYGIP